MRLTLTRLSIFFVIMLLLSVDLSAGDSTTPSDYANKYYGIWDIPRSSGSDGTIIELEQFSQDVPKYMQAAVLDRMLDRACKTNPRSYRVVARVLRYIKNMYDNFPIGETFEHNVYSLAKVSDPIVRRDAIELLGHINREKDREFIVAALEDPSDSVRGAAIHALRDRTDAESLFNKYVQDHQNDADYRVSVMYAKRGLDNLHQTKQGQ
jgi:hypothetical protein